METKEPDSRLSVRRKDLDDQELYRLNQIINDLYSKVSTARDETVDAARSFIRSGVVSSVSDSSTPSVIPVIPDGDLPQIPSSDWVINPIIYSAGEDGQQYGFVSITVANKPPVIDYFSLFVQDYSSGYVNTVGTAVTLTSSSKEAGSAFEKCIAGQIININSVAYTIAVTPTSPYESLTLASSAGTQNNVYFNLDPVDGAWVEIASDAEVGSWQLRPPQGLDIPCCVTASTKLQKTYEPPNGTNYKRLVFAVWAPSPQLSSFTVAVEQETQAGVKSGRFVINFTRPLDPEYAYSSIERLWYVNNTFTGNIGATAFVTLSGTTVTYDPTSAPDPTFIGQNFNHLQAGDTVYINSGTVFAGLTLSESNTYTISQVISPTVLELTVAPPANTVVLFAQWARIAGESNSFRQVDYWPLPSSPGEFWKFRARSVNHRGIANNTSPPTVNVTVPFSTGVNEIAPGTITSAAFASTIRPVDLVTTAGISVTSIVVATNVGTVTTSSAHGLSTGRQVAIYGGTGTSSKVNGLYTITVTGGSTFTVTTAGVLNGTYSAGFFEVPFPVLPSALYPNGAVAFMTANTKLYRSNNSTWTSAADGSDLVANSITAGQIAAGAISTTELFAGEILVGAGSGRPSRFQVVDSATPPNMIGFIGDITTPISFTGGYFRNLLIAPTLSTTTVPRFYVDTTGTVVNASTLTSANNGSEYEIVAVGSTDFTLIGSVSNTATVKFVKSGGSGSGTGTVRSSGIDIVGMNINSTTSLGAYGGGTVSINPNNIYAPVSVADTDVLITSVSYMSRNSVGVRSTTTGNFYPYIEMNRLSDSGGPPAGGYAKLTIAGGVGGAASSVFLTCESIPALSSANFINTPIQINTVSVIDTNRNGYFVNLTLTGSLTAGGGPGTSGQVLVSTGTGVQWSTGVSGTLTSINSMTGPAITIAAGSGISISNASNTVTISSSGGVTSITGTANQVIASAATGAVTLNLPQDIATTSNVIFGSVTTATVGPTTLTGLNLRTDNTTRWSVSSVGMLIPAATDTYDIGILSSNRVRSVYAKVIDTAISGGTGDYLQTRKLQLFDNTGSTTVPAFWDINVVASGVGATQNSNLYIRDNSGANVVKMERVASGVSVSRTVWYTDLLPDSLFGRSIGSTSLKWSVIYANQIGDSLNQVIINGASSTFSQVETGSFLFTASPSAGAFLKSDASGYSSWATIASQLSAGTGISISGTTTATIANTGVISITGTANQVIASGSTGAITLSLPQNINSTDSPTFASIIVGGSGSYVPGAIYSDANWGMIFRAKQASPVTAEFLWASSVNGALMSLSSAAQLSVASVVSTIGFNTTSTAYNSIQTLNGFLGTQLTFTSKPNPGLSGAGTAVIYMDSTSNQLMASVNGVGYVDLLASSGVSSVNSMTGTISIAASTGISIGSASGTVTITNTGVTSITGTANQVIVTGSGAVTLNLPQDIHSAATPIFGGMTLNGALSVTGTVKLGTSSVTGYVWKATDTVGNGGWSAVPTSITGTTDQVIASGSTGAITLNLPQSIATTSDVQFNKITLPAGLSAGIIFSGYGTVLSHVGTNLYLDNLSGNDIYIRPAAGRYTFVAGGFFSPDANNTTSLGHSGHGWSNVYSYAYYANNGSSWVSGTSSTISDAVTNITVVDGIVTSVSGVSGTSSTITDAVTNITVQDGIVTSVSGVSGTSATITGGVTNITVVDGIVTSVS